MKLTKLLAIALIACMLLTMTAFASDAKPYAGTTIHVVLNTHKYYEAADQFIPEFEEATGIKVVMEHVERVSLATKQEMELGSHTGAYDVMLIDGSKVVRYDQAGWVEPLNDYIANDPNFDYSDYIDAYADLLKVGDRIDGIPCVGETTVLFYRKDLFEQVGIEKAPETWADVEAACEKLSAIEGVAPLGLRARAGEGLNVYVWASFLWAFGGQYIDENGYPVLDSEEAIAATQKFAELINKYGPIGGGDMTHADLVPQFQQGKLAMYYDASVWNTNFKDVNSAIPEVLENWAAAPAPMGEGGKGAAAVAAHSLMISKDSKNKEAAWEFIKWYSGAELQTKVALQTETFGAIVHKSIMADEAFEKVFGGHGWIEACEESLTHSRPDYRYTDNPDWAYIGDTIGKAVQDTIIGVGTAESNMKEMNKVLKEFLEENGYIK